jgi:hypothetical protein
MSTSTRSKNKTASNLDLMNLGSPEGKKAKKGPTKQSKKPKLEKKEKAIQASQYLTIH